MRSNPIFPFLFLLLLLACDRPAADREKVYQSIRGETMGTTYSITVAQADGVDLKPAVDSLLRAVNRQVSTWEPGSLISRFNQAEDSLVLGQALDSESLIHFVRNFTKSLEVYEASEGQFDPTVMPLVNYWGFGYTGEKPLTGTDTAVVDSLLRYVGMDKVELRLGEPIVLYKSLPGVELDFSAIAKGYGVDVVGELLRKAGVTDYLVEIGGEVRTYGRNRKGDPWQIGINLPSETAGVMDFKTVVPLSDRALATSGNYRQFYELNGVKYSHTINPNTGFPERNRLLSASVFAPDCITADAVATACMVAGPEAAVRLVERLPEVEAYLIVSGENGQLQVQTSPGLESLNQ